MMQKLLKRRLTILFLSFIIVSLIYLFPKNDYSYSFPMETEYINSNVDNYIFLLDNNDYVSLTTMYISNTDIINKSKEIISILTISDKSSYIPDGFKSIIPENTKVLDISYKNNLLKIDFSKEFLNISKSNARKMIEAIVYSLTNIEGIDDIMIFIEGNKLNKVPHTNEILPLTLNRNIGINRIFDINNYKNITDTTIYYVSEFDNYKYYVPVTLYNNEKKDKIEIIINELKTSISNNHNLFSYLRSNAELLDYEIKENEIYLSFNEFIYDTFNENEVLEEVKYSIMLSIKDNYDVKEVIFIVNDQEISTEVIKNLEK